MENGTHAKQDSIEDSASISLTISELSNRAKTLLSELETFRDHLRRVRHPDVEIAHFRGAVQAEVGMLERLTKKLDDVNTGHIARSSNVPFLESIWDGAKKSRKLRSLQKGLYFNSPNKSMSQAMRHVRIRHEQGEKKEIKNAKVTVDVISDGGLTWTKFTSITNNRLIFDLAKLGWHSEDSEDEDIDAPDDLTDEDEVPLVKMARELCLAAKSYRTRTRHPVVNLVLPRIIPGETKQVDDILNKCRKAGATIFTGENISPAPPLEDVLSIMAPDPFSVFSNTLNIDCTILLALVSEFSHARVAKEPWFHRGLQRQVEIEGNENLLPALLYPALGSRRLVCTREAAIRMREIVATIGTASEKARTEIVFKNESQSTLLQEMQEWSAYPIPSEWRLPVQIVEEDEDNCLSALSPEAQSVGANMTDINRSVFMHGWATGRTTITSNRAVVKQIENDLEKFEDLDEGIWPSIWLCPTARSLVGKEKDKRTAKKEDWEPRPQTLPDPLTREQQRRNGLDVLSAREGREVVDLRPDGYPCEEVIAAKIAARCKMANGDSHEG